MDGLEETSLTLLLIGADYKDGR